MLRAHARLRVTRGGFSVSLPRRRSTVNKLVKTGIAGFAAWKWGGGLIGTIILFMIVYWLLGHF